ncbi:MAG TPA: BatA domain-containing protein, partial [bacterium]|nr:BatA domain-containing protein [bacterium]
MNFLQPVFLWALAGAGLPVLLHFLARKKAKPFPFSTLRFLKISQLTTGRLRKLEEFLILLLRVLVMMLLVLVLAGPVSRRAIGFLQEQLVVLVLDDSYSLRAGEPASPWQQTRQAALTVLASLRKPARVALIFTSGRTTGLTRNLEEVGQTIRDSQATFSSGHLQTALEQAQKILARRTGSRILFVFSDLQRYAWKDLSLPEAGREGISVVVVDTGQKETNNVGLKGLTLLPAQGLCQAEVVNWNQSPVTVEIQLQAGQVEKKSLTLPARESQTVQFKLSRSPGTLRVQLIRPDLLPEDNTYVLHLAPGENNRFLLVTGKQESSFYLETALAAFTAPAQLQVVSVDSLTRISLSDYQMVFLCNTGRWQPEAVRSLADYLREGGQLIVFAGEKDLPENF